MNPVRGTGLAGIVWAYLPVVLIARPRSATCSRARPCGTGRRSSSRSPCRPCRSSSSAWSSAPRSRPWSPGAGWRRPCPAGPSWRSRPQGWRAPSCPGCECSSVPVAGGWWRGASRRRRLTFLPAALAIIADRALSTSIAFPGQPEMVLARFLASLVPRVRVGCLWERIGRPDWLPPARRPSPTRARRSPRSSPSAPGLPAGGRVPGGRGGDGGHPEGPVPACSVSEPPSAARPGRGPGAGGPGGAALGLLRGRRLRRRRPAPVLTHRQAGLPGGRPHGRPETLRPPGRVLRPELPPARFAPPTFVVAVPSAVPRRGGAPLRRVDAGAVVAVSGLFALWMGLSRTALLYVRPSTGTWLVVAGAVLVVFGLGLVLLGRRHPRRRGRRRARPPRRSGWVGCSPCPSPSPSPSDRTRSAPTPPGARAPTAPSLRAPRPGVVPERRLVRGPAPALRRSTSPGRRTTGGAGPAGRHAG